MPRPPVTVDESAILAVLDEIVLFVDAEGRVFFVSESIERILGHRSADIADGEVHWELWHPDELATGLDMSPNVIEGRSVSRLVHRLRHVDGSYRTFESTGRAIALSNGSPGMVVVCRDVTHILAEEQAATKIETQLLSSTRPAELAVMAGGVAHDFGNILQGIMASAELARGVTGDAAQSRSEHLDSIEVASKRAGDLCKQLLAYAGRGTIEREELDLNVMVREMLGILRASISKKVALISQLCEEPVFVSADSTQMRQLTMNLVINAAEAIGDRTGRVIVSTSAEGDEAVLGVDDNGEGMDDETRARILEPFFTQKFEGRGLGLAMVEGTVEAHGGAIEVESKLNVGTRFRVSLPRVRPTAETAQVKEVRTEAALRSASVLFVDDEEMIRRTGSALLQKAKFEVVTAENGAEAVRAVESDPEKFDCIVLDLTMPVMDGTEALALIRRIDPDLPVILCSGYTAHQIEDLLAADPHAVFISKPYHPKRLLTAITEAISPQS